MTRLDSPPKPSRNLDALDSVKIEQDYSKVFTEDMGYIDDKFFEASGLRSPRGKMGASSNPMAAREGQLMKKISELQLELQECRNLVKGLRDEGERVRQQWQEEVSR